MEIYAGNTTLYRYIHRYRQPVFLDRNLRYLFDARTPASTSTANGHHTFSDSGATAAVAAGTHLHHPQSGGAARSFQPRIRKRRIKRQRVAIDDVGERLLSSSVARAENMSASEFERSPFVVQPTLKIEVVNVVKLARSLRSQIGGSPVQLRATNCRCEVQIYRVYESGFGRRPPHELLYQSGEICTLIPRTNSARSGSADSHKTTERNGQSSKNAVVSVVMDEPFYIKASTLAEAGLASLVSSHADRFVYMVAITLRPLSPHSEKSWPFTMETSPSATPLKQQHRKTRAAESEVNSSPTGSGRQRSNSRNSSFQSLSPSPKGAARRSPRARKLSANALAAAGNGTGMRGLRSATNTPPSASSFRKRVADSLATRSDCDADDEQEDGEGNEEGLVNVDQRPGVSLRGEYSFSLLESAEPGTVVPLQFRKNGVPMDVRSGLEIGIEIDMGWSSPTFEEEQAKLKVDEQQRQADQKEKDGPVDNQRVKRVRREDADEGRSSSVRTSTPILEETVEARYHFALEGKFKTFVLRGYGCPWCAMKDYGSYERLHFHFLTSHELFTFRVDRRKPFTIDVYITITGQFLYERASPKVLDIRLMQWLRPKHMKFKLQSFLRGDVSWLQEGASLMMLRQNGGAGVNAGQHHSTRLTTASASGTPDAGGEGATVDSLRLNLASVAPNSTIYDVQTVPTLPPKARRVLPVPETEVRLYTTKGKRLLKTGEEVSESEDEVDDMWLITKHEETIDDFEDVTLSEKEFIKLWDRHIFEERPSSYKHVSESLMRFCRNNRKTLRERTMQIEFWKHCLNLIDCGIIEPACFYACMWYLRNIEIERAAAAAAAEVEVEGEEGRRRSDVDELMAGEGSSHDMDTVMAGS
ncbi:hypothetical protein BZA70DRAFT_282886 [Myxozyma melibiosi]|uniref:Polycomb protein VEFS-Box domain-containing protein n=1 Tax=Myxozyma melibiosi TaxID=54550 RepID=A0ABR1F187_9ASCO